MAATQNQGPYEYTAAPFGGYKQSGFGREMSAHALEHYTQIKSVWVDLNM